MYLNILKQNDDFKTATFGRTFSKVLPNQMSPKRPQTFSKEENWVFYKKFKISEKNLKFGKSFFKGKTFQQKNMFCFSKSVNTFQ